MTGLLLLLVAVLSWVGTPGISRAATVTADIDAKLGGWLQTTFAYDSTEARGNPSGIPATAVSLDDKRNDRKTFRASASRTRFWLNLKGPNTLGARSTGYAEMDFDNRFEEESTASGLRLRKAYGQLEWKVARVEPYLLVGQQTMLLSSAVTTGAIVTGVTSRHGDFFPTRIPQITTGVGIPLGGDLRAIVAAAALRAFSGEDQSGSTAESQTDNGARSARPMFQARAALTGRIWGQSWIVDLSGSDHREIDPGASGTKATRARLKAQAASLETRFPLGPPTPVGAFGVRGGVNYAENGDEFSFTPQAGATNLGTDKPRESLISRGLWGQLDWRTPIRGLSWHTGYTSISVDRSRLSDGSAPRDSGVTVIRNSGVYSFLRQNIQNWAVEFLWMYLETARINKVGDGHDTALRLSVQYRF